MELQIHCGGISIHVLAFHTAVCLFFASPNIRHCPVCHTISKAVQHLSLLSTNVYNKGFCSVLKSKVASAWGQA